MRAAQSEPANCLHRKLGVHLALATLVVFPALHSCSPDSPTAPNTGNTGDTGEPATFSTDHFDIHLYDGLSQADVAAVADRLEAEYGRIVGDLGVAQMPRVNVGIWADQQSFYQAMEALNGMVYFGAGGYILGPTGFRMLMTGDPGQIAVHEFVHVVTLNINRSFSNDPRWLWEAVAVFEAGEFVEPTSLSFMNPGSFPTLAQLNVDYDQGYWIYQVGYVLTEYIVETWGFGAVISLIASNGDIQGTLGITEGEFEEGWHAWLSRKYF